MQTYRDQVQALEKLRDDVREQAQANGWDPASERAKGGWHLVPGQMINDVWSALNQAARSIVGLEHASLKLAERNGKLNSANGALMVDRTRGIAEATERARGALLWASGIARKYGIPEEEWPAEARFRLGQESDAWSRLEAERDRLENLRTSVVCALITTCENSPDGFSADQVKRLLGTLKAANRKAMG